MVYPNRLENNMTQTGHQTNTIDWTITEQQDNAIDCEKIDYTTEQRSRLDNGTTKQTGHQNNNNRQHTYGVSATYANG